MKPLHILVAEDESLIRLGLSRILQEAGHTVSCAEDGEAALTLVGQRTPDLVILDIKMPRMNGLDAARQIHAQTPVPIIFLTAYGEQELVEQAARLPVMGYLIKPFQEAELLAMVEVVAARFAEHARVARDAAEATAALATQQTLDRARGLLMQQEGLSEHEASIRLEQRARAERRTLLEAAEQIVGELERPEG